MHLITVNVKDEEAQALTEKLEASLMEAGYEVLTDDRNERVGVKFSDSDLIGLQSVSLSGKKSSRWHCKLRLKRLVTPSRFMQITCLKRLKS